MFRLGLQLTLNPWKQVSEVNLPIVGTTIGKRRDCQVTAYLYSPKGTVQVFPSLTSFLDTWNAHISLVQVSLAMVKTGLEFMIQQGTFFSQDFWFSQRILRWCSHILSSIFFLTFIIPRGANLNNFIKFIILNAIANRSETGLGSYKVIQRTLTLG